MSSAVHTGSHLQIRRKSVDEGMWDGGGSHGQLEGFTGEVHRQTFNGVSDVVSTMSPFNAF